MVVKLLSGVAGGIIGVTEPRRVAAVCMARRVAEEMNLTSRFAFFWRLSNDYFCNRVNCCNYFLNCALIAF